MKKLLSFLVLILGITTNSCELINELSPEVFGCSDPNSFNYDPNATSSGGDCYSMIGCLSYKPRLNYSGTIVNSFDDYNADNFFQNETRLQKQFFRDFPATVNILREPSPDHANAYAYSTGDILFGYHYFWEEVQNYGPTAIAGTLAHEWGHIVQYAMPWDHHYRHVRDQELEADAMAGFYLALTIPTLPCWT